MNPRNRPQTSAITPRQEAHLTRVKRRVADRMDRKYLRGQREHGGNLWQKTPLALVEDALDEVADLAAYLETLKDQLHSRKENPCLTSRRN